MPELWISFNHPGQSGEHCRDLSPEEVARQPVHMRRTRLCERGRAPVRLEVRLDGALVQRQSYAPSGLAGDGNSVAIDRHVVTPGPHEVEVRIGDGPDPAVYEHTERRTLVFSPRSRRVVLFDKAAGFTWR